MNTSLEDFHRWLTQPKENENIEFKEAKTQYDLTKTFRYCVAIANERGGKLILGVSDKPPRKVVGTNAFQNLDEIKSKIFQKLGFRVDIEEFRADTGRVLIFHIPSRPSGTAYNYDGTYLMRSTEDTVPMSEDQLRKIFAEGKTDWLSKTAARNQSADDIIRTLDTQSYFDLLKIPYPVDRAGVIDKFEKEKLIIRTNETWAITNLGAILFAKDLQDFDGLAGRAPRVIVYDGSGKTRTKLDRVGSKGYAVGFPGLIEFINAQLPTNEIVTNAIRQDVKMFPELAIRELVANALIHQDFGEQGFVVVEIYSDRLEITNPGKPFISPDRFIDEYGSRNERLADIMRRLGICEEKGSGIDKVVEGAELFQLPAPDFRVLDRHTTAILFAPISFDEMDGNDRIRACYQHCCLRYVMNQKMTNQTLRERFKLSESKIEAVSRVIRETVEMGKIKLSDPSIASMRYRNYVPFWA